MYIPFGREKETRIADFFWMPNTTNFYCKVPVDAAIQYLNSIRTQVLSTRDVKILSASIYWKILCVMTLMELD